MKHTSLLLFLSVLICNLILAQSKTERARQAQEELSAEYAGTDSPLKPEDRTTFTGLPFFAIDTNFVVMAHLERLENEPTFTMPTTTSRMATYRRYGILYFSINGQNFTLNVYQSPSLKTKAGYEDYLFLPFKDLTNGTETYGGGRYLDLRIPVGDSIEIDFNKCYNPYCAYNHKYSCPIVPQENFVDFEIKAGVRYESY